MAPRQAVPFPLAFLSPSDSPRICGLCAEEGRSCCQIPPQEGELFFPVSDKEIARIRRVLPWLAEEELVVAEPNSAAFLDRLGQLFPQEEETIKSILSPAGEHWRLASDGQGRCVCLGLYGCLLPYHFRPLYCRLFPFWVKNGRLNLHPYDHCLALKQARSIPHLLDQLGMTRETVEFLYRQLRRCWGLDRRPRGHIEPSILGSKFASIRAASRTGETSLIPRPPNGLAWLH